MLVSLRYCTFVFWSPKYMYNQTRACEVSVCQKVVEFFEISPTIWGPISQRAKIDVIHVAANRLQLLSKV